MYIRKVKSNFDKSILVYNRWFFVAFYPDYEGAWIGLSCRVFILKCKPNKCIRLIPLSLIVKESYLKFYPTNKNIYIRYSDGTTSY